MNGVYKKRIRLLLRSLYKYRGEAAGATQAERHRLAAVQRVIEKIEGDIEPLKARLTSFDRQMNESFPY